MNARGLLHARGAHMALQVENAPLGNNKLLFLVDGVFTRCIRTE
jgi:hypothetical protein